jgi:hypothetical protein
MFKFTTPVIVMACVFAGGAAAQDQPAKNPRSRIDERAERNDLRTIHSLMAEGRCTQAVEALKPGLRAKRPGFLLLAGLMHDEGFCVKADWEKAVSLYTLALQAGSETAAPRLVAGYARPGRDNGLALWWVAKSHAAGGFPRQCIPQADPERDLDGFNAGLEVMPPATFKACVYLVGVVAAVHAEREFPQLALQHGVTGTYTMSFDPSRGSITWQQDAFEINENLGRWARDMAQEELENPRKIRDSLLAYLKRKGEFALTRYPKPDGGLPEDYVYKSSFFFTIE